MVFLDFTLILDYLVALAIVALPVEIMIVLQVQRFRVKVTGLLDSPEKRRELMAEVAEELWEPFREPEQRAAIIEEIGIQVWKPLSTPENRQKLLQELWAPFDDPEKRAKLISDLGHGLFRVLAERSGSAKGVAARENQAAGIEQLVSGQGGLGALSMIKGKIELPIIGKVTPLEAFQLFQSLKGMNLQGLLGGAGAAAGQSTSAGLPP